MVTSLSLAIGYWAGSRSRAHSPAQASNNSTEVDGGPMEEYKLVSGSLDIATQLQVDSREGPCSAI